MNESQKFEELPNPDKFVSQVEQLIEKTLEFNPTDPVLGMDEEDVITANMKDFINDPETIIPSIMDEEGNVLAVNVITPIGRMDRRRKAESQETAYIYFTSVDPELQGLGLVKGLNEATMKALQSKGYKYVEIDAAHKSGYAQKLSESYKDAIIGSRVHNDWGLGDQTSLRIDLGKVA